YESSLAAANSFTVDNYQFHFTAGLDSWGGHVSPDGNPSVTHNSTANPITYFSLIVNPGELMLHPGPNGERSIVRFTTPVAALYDLSAAFASRDVNHGGTDVHVLVNNSSIFDAQVVTNSPSFAASALLLKVGDIVDFAVGAGSDGTFFNDATSLVASLTVHPAPTTTTDAAPTVTYGANGLVTVTVTAPAGVPVPTGSVALAVDGGTPTWHALSAQGTA